MPGQFRSAGDILFTDHPPMPGQISDVQLKQFSETSNFLQCLEPLTADKPFFAAQIRALSDNSKISIGIAGPDIAEDGTPGRWINTVGYCSDGVCRSSHNETANTYGAKYGIGDMFGVFVSHFGKQMSTVTFTKNGQPVATRYHFEPDHKKFLPTITLENGPIDLGIMWPQAVMAKPQFSDKNMIQWMTGPDVVYNMANNTFVLSTDEEIPETSGTIQSPVPLSREFEHFEAIVQDASETGAGPAVGVATCSLLKPTPTCKAVVDFFRLLADGENVKVVVGDRIGIGVHYPKHERENPNHNDKSQQLVLVFVTLNISIVYARILLQPEGGFFPIIVLTKNCTRVTVDVTTSRKIDTYENLDLKFDEYLEEANCLMLNDSLKRQLKLEMFRKSEPLKIEVHEQTPIVDPSKQYCRIRLTKDDMGIHVIQFRQPLTKVNPYYCIEIRKLHEDSVLTIGVADSKFPLNKHPGKLADSTGYCSRDGSLYYNTQHEGHLSGERFGEGDMVGMEVSNFGRKHPVALFSKNLHGVDRRYVTILHEDQFLPTVALCGNGYEVEIDVYWQNQYLRGPGFRVENLKDWCYPPNVIVDRSNRIFTVPEHDEPVSILSPRPFEPDSNHDYFEVKILDNFGKVAGAPPPGIALCSPCPQDVSLKMSSNFRLDFVRFLAIDDAEASVSVGDSIGWGVLFPKSERDKSEDRLIICYLCINLKVALTRIIYEPVGGIFPLILLHSGVNRVKLGRINYINKHPITPKMEEDLLKEAKDIIAKEKQAKTEGNDPQEMGIDKSLLIKLFHEESQQQPEQRDRNSATVAGSVELQPKMKSASCVLL